MTRKLVLSGIVLACCLWAVSARADGLQAESAPPTLGLGGESPRQQQKVLENQRHKRAVDDRLRYTEMRAKLDRLNVNFAEFRRRQNAYRDAGNAAQRGSADRFLENEGQRLDTTLRRVEDAERSIRTERRLSGGTVGHTRGMQRLYLDSLR